MKSEILNQLWKYQQMQDISNRELARRLNVADVYVYRWKKGNIGKAWQLLIAEFLHRQG